MSEETEVTKEDDTTALLRERGTTHGEYSDNARATWEMFRSLESLPGYRGAPPEVLHAAYMVVHKLSRAFSGDLLYDEHWADVIGYAQLVRDRLPALRERGAEKQPQQDIRKVVVGLELNSTVFEARLKLLAERVTELSERAANLGEGRGAADADIYEHMALFWGVERDEARRRVHDYLVRLHEAPSDEEASLLEKLRRAGLSDLSLEEAEDVLRTRERRAAQTTMAEEMRDKSLAPHRTYKTGPDGQDLPLEPGDPVFVKGYPARATVVECDEDWIEVRWPSVSGTSTHPASSVVYAREARPTPDPRLVPRRVSSEAESSEPSRGERWPTVLTWKQYEDLRGREVQEGSRAGAMVWHLYQFVSEGDAERPDVFARMREPYVREYGR